MEELEEDVVDDPFLGGDAFALGRIGDLEGGDHAGEYPAENKQGEGVGTEDAERPRPTAVALDVDEPVAAAEDEQGETRGREDVRARPERLVHREIAVPDEPEGEKDGAGEKDGGRLGK